MSDEQRDEAPAARHDDERVDARAQLLPEERAAGSDAPLEQAEAILEESDERTEHPEQTRLESPQTPDPR